MKLYVYCVLEGLDALDEAVVGISGAPVRLEKLEDLGVLVSDFDDDAVHVTRENAMAHAAVVRSVLDLTTPLPFRFGTLVTQQQLRNYLSARKPALETNLSLVRDCVEMSVKIISALEEKAPKENREEPAQEQGIGTTFLAAKRRELLGSGLRSAQAKEISTWLNETVSGLTRDVKVSVQPSEKLFLAAAHLVERAGLKQYRLKMAAARAARPDLRFLSSGPWPPYSFTNIELEFKTQFGVS